jgi:hypothetical protein
MLLILACLLVTANAEFRILRPNEVFADEFCCEYMTDPFDFDMSLPRQVDLRYSVNLEANDTVKLALLSEGVVVTQVDKTIAHDQELQNTWQTNTDERSRRFVYKIVNVGSGPVSINYNVRYSCNPKDWTMLIIVLGLACVALMVTTIDLRKRYAKNKPAFGELPKESYGVVLPIELPIIPAHMSITIVAPESVIK